MSRLGSQRKDRRVMRTQILLCGGKQIPFSALTRFSLTLSTVTLFYDLGDGERAVVIDRARMKAAHIDAVRNAIQNRLSG